MEKIKFGDGKYIYTVSDEMLFVDHSKAGRSGHLGHGMVETAPGRVIAFYPDNSGDKWSGHTAEGYAKYRISEDGGKTWGDGIDFPFSKALCDMKIDVYSSVEKAVRAKNGDIVAFNFICDLIDNNGCGYEPFRIPSYVISRDGGLTWGEPKKICPRRARIYDARVFDGDIYVLINYGENSTDKTKLTVYHMLKSVDNGETFEDISSLPFWPDFSYSRYYGTMEKLPDGSIIVYTYRDLYDEMHIEYTVSRDGGKTWDDVKVAYCAKRIRNPQLIKFKTGYFMFGRSGSRGEEYQMGHNVMYFSTDGINWDEGHYLKMRTEGAGAYSNAIIVHDGGKERLLLQMSHAYEKNRTNIYHWFIDAEEIKG